MFLATVFVASWFINANLKLRLDWLPAVNALATVIFVGLPIATIAAAARIRWRPIGAASACATFLAIVVLLRGGGALLDGIVQLARFGWPAAFGFLISGLIRDKNLLLPIAIVLLTVDILAVFAPSGTVKQGLSSPTIRPIFDALAYQVPEAGSARPLAQMGPADPLFIGMFLHAIHKFRMNFRGTILWLIPALVAYLAIVLLAGDSNLLGFSLSALPALVPISIVVVSLNAKYFKPSRQELQMTIGVAIVCAALIAWLAFQER